MCECASLSPCQCHAGLTHTHTPTHTKRTHTSPLQTMLHQWASQATLTIRTVSSRQTHTHTHTHTHRGTPRHYLCVRCRPQWRCTHGLPARWRSVGRGPPAEAPAPGRAPGWGLHTTAPPPAPEASVHAPGRSASAGTGPPASPETGSGACSDTGPGTGSPPGSSGWSPRQCHSNRCPRRRRGQTARSACRRPTARPRHRR